MGSTGGGKTTTTQTSQPWSAQIPYLQNIMGTAQQLWNEDTQQPVPVNNIYGSYVNAASNLGLGPLVGEGQFSDVWRQLLNAPQNTDAQMQQLIASGTTPGFSQQQETQQQAAFSPEINARIQQMLQTSAQPAVNQRIQDVAQSGTDPGVQQQLQALIAASQGTNQAIPGLQSAAQSQWANPLAGAAMGVTGGNNQYINQTAQLAGLGLANPALSGLANTASGSYLTPDTNPYLHDTVQNALNQAQASIASQFNAGGRYGSGMMAGTQARELGNIATGAYANAYESERARQEAANQALGQQFLSGAGLASSGAQAAGQLQQGQQGLGLQGVTAAGNLLGQQQQLGQQALTALGSLSGEDLNRQLQGQTSATQGYLQDVQNRMAAQQAALQGQLGYQGQLNEAQQAAVNAGLQNQGLQNTALQNISGNMLANTQNQMGAQQGGMNALLQSLGLQNSALNFAPTYQGMQQTQLGNLGNAAQVEQQLMNLPQEQRWQELQNWLGAVNGNYGSTVQGQVPTTGTNIFGNVLGGLATGAGLASLFSSRAFKDEIAPVDEAQVAAGVARLPLRTWLYKGNDAPHIGPYAEDFRDIFGVGNGVTIAYVDLFGVLLTTVKHLLAQNAELTARVEDLENGF